MLFNSYIYIFLFLPMAVVGYFFLSRFGSAYSRGFLLLCSLFFYGFWDVDNLIFLILSIFFNFFVGLFLSRSAFSSVVRGGVFFVGVVFNLLFLSYYKYINFLIDNLNFIFDIGVNLREVGLPLAISFFTLTQIAYLVDCYENPDSKVGLIDYFNFITFFPHLLAGPIIHHKKTIPQFHLEENKNLNVGNVNAGLYLFSIGLFKKVVVADTFAIWANNGFAHGGVLNFIEAWFSVMSYTFQMYYDFSGYMDMALGSALMLNIRLPVNFNSPYKSKSIIEYWRRWHITLTDFLTTYLYTPLVRSMRTISFRKVMVVTFFVFLVSGIWHGANWTFVVWGGLHGLALVANHIWKRYKFKMNGVFSWILTFIFINVTYVFFRAEDINSAKNIFFSLFDLTNIVLPEGLKNYAGFLNGMEFVFSEKPFQHLGAEQMLGGNYVVPLFLLLAIFVSVRCFNSQEMLQRFVGNFRTMLQTSVLLLISLLVMNSTTVTEFLYYNF